MRYLLFSFNLLLLWWLVSPIAVQLRERPYNYYIQNVASNGSTTNFSYDPASPNSPANWPQFAPNCGGTSQSPINIHKSKLFKMCKHLGGIAGTKWMEKPTSITVDNNGHTVRFVFDYVDLSQPNIIVNDSVYVFSHLHFHFGLDGKSGTEHHIDYRAYAMEGHAVFYNRNYGSVANSLLHADGLAVIGRLYEQYDRRTVVDIDFDFLQFVRNPQDVHVIDGTGTTELFTLNDIMGPLDLPYYMYHGSLTTPGCNEVVTWCVGAKTLKISRDQMVQFRLLNGEEGLMAPNVRPIQKRNARKIYSHKRNC